jgi:hypothetical protein
VALLARALARLALTLTLGAASACGPAVEVPAGERAPFAPGATFEQVDDACQPAFRERVLPACRACGRRLRELDPSHFAAWAYEAEVATAEGRFADAERARTEAEARGLPAWAVDMLEQRIARDRERWKTASLWSDPLLWVIGALLGAYALGLGALDLAGRSLSKRADVVAEEATEEATGRPVGLAGTLRTAYRWVLRGCAVWYYVGAATMLACLVLGLLVLARSQLLRQHPLVAPFVALPLLLGVLAFLVGLFVRAERGDPGVGLPLDDAPALRALLREVARKIGTRPVDHVFFVPGAELGVTEREGAERPERLLVIGVVILHFLRLDEFRAILAHEYGHFRNADVSVGRLDHAARTSLAGSLQNLIATGRAKLWNPIWWMALATGAVFARATAGASRLQEVLADRFAIHAFGSEPFERALRCSVIAHVVAHELLDEVVGRAAVGLAADANLYAPLSRLDLRRRSPAIEAVLREDAESLSSHPTVRARVQLARRLHASAPVAEGDDAPAWSLIPPRTDLEILVTARLLGELRDRGLPRPVPGVADPRR